MSEEYRKELENRMAEIEAELNELYHTEAATPRQEERKALRISKLVQVFDRIFNQLNNG